jgi:MFS family permease
MRFVIERRARVFALTWVGQTLSALGSGLTSFALGVEVYRTTGSMTQFSLVTFFHLMPPVLLSPFAGVVVDRWDRRKVMLLADVGAAAGPLWMLALLFAAGFDVRSIAPWKFYAPIAIGSAFEAFRWPAYTATATLLVARQHLGRVSGMIELGNGVAQVAAPVVAALLLGHVGLPRLLWMDFASFAFAVATLLAVRFPRPAASDSGRDARGTLLDEVAFGWRFIRARPGLLRLMLFIAAINVVVGFVMVLITPLVLSFADVPTLGEIQSLAGAGMLAGGVTMAVWGGPRRRIHGVLGFTSVLGLALLAAGAPPSAFVVGGAAFVFLFSVPIVSGCAQAIWQAQVAPDIQGRVFAVRRMIALVALPIASLLAGPLSERAFEPWLARGGPLADTVGRIVGVGPGRGIGFLFVVASALTIAGVLAAWRSHHVRDVEAAAPSLALSGERLA